MTPPPVPAPDPQGDPSPVLGRPMEPLADSRARDWSMTLGALEMSFRLFDDWHAEHERRKEQA